MAVKDSKATAKAVVPTAKKKASKAVEVKTIEQLRDDLVKAQQDLIDSRRSNAQGELVNVHVITVQRKAVARLKTAINNESRKESK